MYSRVGVQRGGCRLALFVLFMSNELCRRPSRAAVSGRECEWRAAFLGLKGRGCVVGPCDS